MKKSLWLLSIGLVILAGYILPYTLFVNSTTWTGAPLFWLVYGGLVLILIIARLARWRI